MIYPGKYLSKVYTFRKKKKQDEGRPEKHEEMLNKENDKHVGNYKPTMTI